MTPNINRLLDDRLLDEFKKWYLTAAINKTASPMDAVTCYVPKAHGVRQSLSLEVRCDGAQMKQAPGETNIAESHRGVKMVRQVKLDSNLRNERSSC